jgi:hypothetical protein
MDVLEMRDGTARRQNEIFLSPSCVRGSLVGVVVAVVVGVGGTGIAGGCRVGQVDRVGRTVVVGMATCTERGRSGPGSGQMRSILQRDGYERPRMTHGVTSSERTENIGHSRTVSVHLRDGGRHLHRRGSLPRLLVAGEVGRTTMAHKTGRGIKIVGVDD